MKRSVKWISLLLSGVVAFTALTPVPVLATSSSELTELMAAVETGYGYFQEIGFDYASLSKVLHTEYGEGFWGEEPTPRAFGIAQQEQMENLSQSLQAPLGGTPATGSPSTRDGDPYDGNPPATAAEQAQ